VIGGIRITFVVAIARNGVIGANGGMPWRLPSDLARFKALTLGHPLVMGRKTYESIGRPLPGRDNIVVTRRRDFRAAGVHLAATIEDALAIGVRLAGERGVKDIMVIGGGEIYAALLARADRIVLTRVDVDVAGDTSFPELASGEWRETSLQSVAKDAGDSAPFTVSVLERTAR
jgi:dihydrofolate reductase